ncbi:MAG: TIGR03792 family protein [Cyanobacteria bacterium SBLK]|nr:TIGR03792 family protein [Cyanobacteria bacterium SBLK]
MIIEWLKFKVAAEERERFIQIDEDIWTEALAKYPGFLGKEVWLSPNPEEVALIVRWRTKADWSAIPVDVLQKTERRFAIAFGQPYDLFEEGEYQVRKFLHNGS